MEFLNKTTGVKIKGLLDTEESVAQARRTLEEATEEEFEIMRIAGAKSWHGAKEIILD